MSDNNSGQPLFMNLVDGESYAAANKFLEAMSEAESYHHFGCSDDVLKDYREFMSEWRQYDRLPPEIRKYKGVKAHYNNAIRSSWGNYAADWLWKLKQADMDEDGLAYVLQDMQAAGFLPLDYALES